MKDLKNIVPEEMLNLDHWVCHGTDKKPLNPMTLQYARTNDSSTWTSYEQAKQVAEEQGLGIGFVFYQTDIIGIDVDHCYDAETNKFSDICIDICKTMQGAYIEKSYSGTGVHIYCKGTTQGVFKNSKLGVEMYDKTSPRYFTVTGDRLKPCDGLVDLTEQASTVYQKYSNKQELEQPMVKTITNQSYDQDEIVRLAQVDPLFVKLWKGDLAGLPSQSDADFVLCKILAYWTNGNPEKIDELFRQSDAMRYKWDTIHGGSSYGSQTIKKAIARCDYYPPIVSQDDDNFTDEDIALFAQEIEPIEWIPDWEGFLPKGMTTMFFGDGGSGKSLIACHLLSKATQRGENVCYFPGEENMKKIVIPRLIVAGVDTKFMHIPQKVKGEFLKFGNPKIEKYIQKWQPSIVIFDPLIKFFSEDDSNASLSVRRVMEPLYEMAEYYNCCIIVIHHKPKSGNGAMGSADFKNSVRSAIDVVNNDGTVILTLEKTNLSKKGSQKCFEIDVKNIQGKNQEIPVPFVTEVDSEQQGEENDDWVLEVLKDGKLHTAEEIDEKGKVIGLGFHKRIDARTRLRDKGLIRGTKKDNKYFWQLRNNENPFED